MDMNMNNYKAPGETPTADNVLMDLVERTKPSPTQQTQDQTINPTQQHSPTQTQQHYEKYPAGKDRVCMP